MLLNYSDMKARLIIEAYDQNQIIIDGLMHLRKREKNKFNCLRFPKIFKTAIKMFSAS